MSELKYPNPKIAAIDLSPKIVSKLRNSGFNIEWGTFGRPYKVGNTKNELFPVIPNHTFPKTLIDKKIIIIDLCNMMLLPPHLEGHPDVSGTFLYWAETKLEAIDPRYLSMYMSRKYFDFIYNNGGIFIIFANAVNSSKFQKVKGCVSETGEIEIPSDTTVRIEYNNWYFLSQINSKTLSIEDKNGKEIKILKTFLEDLLSEYQKEFQFNCQIFPEDNEIRSKWSRLAIAPDNATVAAAINEIPENKGCVLLLPNLSDRTEKTNFIFKLITEYLPDIAPNLFPKLDNNKNWLYSEQYEIPKIRKICKDLDFLKLRFNAKISEIERSIERERENLAYWHHLITETKEPLIDAVKKALQKIGFQEIIQPNKEEDLQIKDYSPILLLEIVGITGSEIEEKDLQVWKYLAPRMQEFKTFEIQGLIIVNSQKNIPPLERDNENIFNEAVMNKAKEYNLGLATTWDIYRLVRNYEKLGWKHENIKDIFYQVGRIKVLPNHYQYIGIVEKFWPKVSIVAVKIKNTYLQIGDRIAFDLPIEFIEKKVKSLQHDKKLVDRVDPGNLAGVKIEFIKERLPQGTRIFKVVNPPDNSTPDLEIPQIYPLESNSVTT